MSGFYERGTPVKQLERATLGAIAHPPSSREKVTYRGTSLTRKRTPLGPHRRPMPRVLGGSWGGGRFLMGEVTLSRKWPVGSYALL